MADDAADAATDKLRASLETKVDRIREAISKAEDRVREAESKESNSRSDELLSGVGDVLGGLLGGRKSSRSILSGLRRAGSKRKSRDAAAERVETAQNRLGEKLDDLEELENELADSLEDILTEWDDKAANVATLEVSLEKTDISVDQLALVWIRTE